MEAHVCPAFVARGAALADRSLIPLQPDPACAYTSGLRVGPREGPHAVPHCVSHGATPPTATKRPPRPAPCTDARAERCRPLTRAALAPSWPQGRHVGAQRARQGPVGGAAVCGGQSGRRAQTHRNDLRARRARWGRLWGARGHGAGARRARRACRGNGRGGKVGYLVG